MKRNVGRFWKLRVHPGWPPTMKEGPQFTNTRYWIQSKPWMRLEVNSSPVPSVRNSALSTSWFQPCEMLKRDPDISTWASDLQRVQVRNLCCFQLLNVWSIFYNSNRKLWQVAVIAVKFVCVSYHLEGIFIHKAIQRVFDSLGLGWVWETAFFSFFFSLHL